MDKLQITKFIKDNDLEDRKRLSIIGPTSKLKDNTGKKFSIYKKGGKELTKRAKEILPQVVPSFKEPIKNIMKFFLENDNKTFKSILKQESNEKPIEEIKTIETQIKPKEENEETQNEVKIHKKTKVKKDRFDEKLDQELEMISRQNLTQEKKEKNQETSKIDFDNLVKGFDEREIDFDKFDKMKSEIKKETDKINALNEEETKLKAEEEELKRKKEELENKDLQLVLSDLDQQRRSQETETELVIVDNKVIKVEGIDETQENLLSIEDYVEQVENEKKEFIIDQQSKKIEDRQALPEYLEERVIQETKKKIQDKMKETVDFIGDKPLKPDAKSPLQILDPETGEILKQETEEMLDQTGATPEEPQTKTQDNQSTGELPTEPPSDEPPSGPPSQEGQNKIPDQEGQASLVGRFSGNDLDNYVSLHTDSIGFFFRSSTRPQFDKLLLQDRNERLKDQDINELKPLLLFQNKSLFELYGPKMLIYKLKTDDSSPIEQIVKENFELLQLFNAIEKVVPR